ncbi:MAG: (4Fe-4S)-binding protein [Actinomycetota bacterium]
MNPENDAVRDPSEAGAPRTTGPTRTYESDEIRVMWDASRCIHVANCLRALPEVFDVRARPWIDINGASAERVAEAVLTCPTGALRYEAIEGVDDEVAEEPAAVEIRPNGPLYVRGRVRVMTPTGEVLADETRLALCRCGASQNKPFCDNSHRLIGFRG